MTGKSMQIGLLSINDSRIFLKTQGKTNVNMYSACLLNESGIQDISTRHNCHSSAMFIILFLFVCMLAQLLWFDPYYSGTHIEEIDISTEDVCSIFRSSVETIHKIGYDHCHSHILRSILHKDTNISHWSLRSIYSNPKKKAPWNDKLHEHRHSFLLHCPVETAHWARQFMCEQQLVFYWFI